MKLTYRQYRKAKKTPFLGSWCLLSGPEHHLKREVLSGLREEIEGAAGDPDQLTWETLEGSELVASVLVTRCQIRSLFGGVRLIVVQRAEKMDSREQDSLARQLPSLSSQTSVILVTGESGGRRSRGLGAALRRAIAAEGLVIEFPALKAGEATAWAIAHAKSLGKKLAPAAANKLTQQKVGNDLTELESELEKLALFVGDGDTISSEDVDRLTPRLIEEDVYRVVEAVAAQRAGQAVAVLRPLLVEKKEPAVRILWIIAQAIREIWQIKLLSEGGWRSGEEPDEVLLSLLPEDERKNALKQLARKQWLIPHRVQQARRFSWQRLEAGVEALHACDLAIKGASGAAVDDALALELLIVQLCTGLLVPAGGPKAG